MKNPQLATIAVLLILVASIGLLDTRRAAEQRQIIAPAKKKLSDAVDQLKARQMGKNTSKLMSQRKRRVKGYLNYDAPDQFARYHKSIRTRAGDNGPAYRTNYRVDALMKARRVVSTRAFGKQAARDPLPWMERGPGNVAGRARIILVDPEDATHNTWFVGTASGGVWKTPDAGLTWEELTVGVPNLATTTLAMPLSNPNVIYMGTGEGFGTFAFIYGQGIWKSTDKGGSWEQLASTAGDDRFTNTMRLVVDPNDENVLVAATSTGARNNIGETSYIFRSTDGGQSWTKTYESSVSGSSGRVEQVVTDPQNFAIQFATVNGTGVLKSEDGGATWVEVFAVRDTGASLGRMEMAVSPSDASVVYVAAEGGSASGSSLYASSDGGATWQKTGAQNGRNLDWLGGQGWYDNTIAVHPFDPATVYVGGIDLMEIKLTGEDASEKITRFDESETSNVFGLLFQRTGPQLAENFFAESDILPADFVSLEVRFGPGKSQKAHRFVLSNASFSFEYQDYVDVPFELWDVENNSQLMVAIEDGNGNGQWDLIDGGSAAEEGLFLISADYDAASPHGPSTENLFSRALYAVILEAVNAQVDVTSLPEMNLRVVVETAPVKGTSINPVTDGYGQYGGRAKGVHVDHHYILLHPTDEANGDYLFLNANDGGIAFSSDKGATFTQSGETFSQLPDGGGTTNTPLRGLNTSQFYGADKMNGADRYVGGTQDNGSWVSPAEADVNSAWIQAPSGDGFEAAWHYRESNWIIETSQFNNFLRSQDGGKTWQQLNVPGSGPFLTRVGKSNQDADLIFGVNNAGVIRSEDFGSTWTQVAIPGWQLLDGTVRISIASPDIVWAASAMTSSQPPFVSTDGGQSFAPTNAYTNEPLGPLTDMVTHPTDPNTAFALFSFADAPKVLKTTDLGQTWVDLSGYGSGTSNNGFPDVATYSLLVMPFDENLIWAGTEIGLFVSTDGGQQWAYADNGLPAVAIYQMRIVNDEVVLATHGRGIWSVALPELEGYEPPSVILKPTLTEVTGGLGGTINLAVQLRAPYDSTLVLVDGEVVRKIEQNADRFAAQVELMVSASEVRTLDIQAAAYVGGTPYFSAKREVTVAPVFDARTSYTSDFATPPVEMLLDGFTQEAPAGFSDGALHTTHPYPDQTEYVAMLLAPIIVASQDAILQYDDVAIIEPGENGAPFGDPAFYDYVVVEGSSDGGLSWTALADGYDATYNGAWLNAYDDAEAGSAGLFVQHQVDLLQTFNAGDEILIRFRLSSDESATGWGWAIDNLRIQDQTATSIDDETGIPAVFSLSDNYPNPFNPVTTIGYSLATATQVEMAVYDVAGRRVRLLVPQQEQAAGTYSVTWDGRNDAGAPVASGMYLYRMQTDAGFVASRKMILLK